MIHVVFLLLLFASCAEKKTTNPFFDNWRILAEHSREKTLPRDKTMSARQSAPVIEGADKPDQDIPDKTRKEPPTPSDVGKTETAGPAAEPEKKQEKRFPDSPVSIRLPDVDVAVLIRSLARSVHLNIMLSEQIRGKASLSIQNAPWDQVFTGVLKTHGLIYRWEGDILRILTLNDVNQELKMEETRQRIETQKHEEALKRLDLEEQKARKKRLLALAGPLVTRIVQVKYSDVEKLKSNLERFLEKDKEENRGSIAVDEHTRSLIIHAPKEDVNNMLSLINALDRPIYQVLIDAYIVETSRETALELGMRWGGLYHGLGSNTNHWITPGQGNALNAATTADQQANPVGGTIINLPSLADNGLNIGYVSQKLGKYLLTAQLSALETDGKINILSSPSITTLDNQTATIESGREVPYQNIEDGDVETEFKKATLKLEVTPHVIDGQMLKMEINTQKDEVDTSYAENPPIITKSAKTTVMLADGQTTVIGGLSKEMMSDREEGVPFLKDIPLLGALFKSRGNMTNMEEILIFITPHILERPETDGPSQESE